ncbi:MAG TPA: class I SAM-dependent methyltransferase [Armatimonadota bacterium]|nr:class I SAM-dependent methyltransferase [Armatimonadota bacterium]
MARRERKDLTLEDYRELVAAAGEFMFPEHWAMVGNIGTIASHIHHYNAVANAIEAADDVLDVGCGCGLATRLYRLQTTGRVVAVDRPPAIDIARSLYYSPGVEYWSQDFVEEALPEGEFDVAVLTEVYEHLPEAVGHKVVGEIAARLRPEGRLYMSVPLLSRGEQQASKNFANHCRDWADEEAVLDEVAGMLSAGQTVGLVFLASIVATKGGCKGT